MFPLDGNRLSFKMIISVRAMADVGRQSPQRRTPVWGAGGLAAEAVEVLDPLAPLYLRCRQTNVDPDHDLCTLVTSVLRRCETVFNQGYLQG